MRTIELTDGVWSDVGNGGDGELFLYFGGGVFWDPYDCEYADWRDDNEKFDAIVKLAAKGEEVVVLEDGSDTYIFASMADAIDLVRTD